MLPYLALAMVGQSAHPVVEDRRPVLWQSLREGMSMDETALALPRIEGVTGATIKDKGKKSQRLTIGYADSDFVLAGLAHTIIPSFKDDRLQSVKLRSEACLSLATEKYKALRDMLGDKYGVYRTQREVTEDRQLAAFRDAFNSGPTRVTMRLEPGDVPQHIYLDGKVGSLLANFTNDSVDRRSAECPTDVGQRAAIEINYASELAAAVGDAAQQRRETESRARDKSKL